MPTLYLIDGYAQFFRAYHAIRTPMTSPVTKEPTNMTFGFVGMLLKLLRGGGKMGGPPDYVAVALDVSGDRGTFRSEIYPEYKANRDAPPEDLEPQVRRCLAMLAELGVPALGAEGFEADDVIATLVAKFRSSRPGLNIRLVSKDKDLKQLLAEGALAGPAGGPAGGELGGNREGDRRREGGAVELYDVHTDTLFDVRTLRQETGLLPGQVVDMLALAGDTVDNVPGVPGVGEKTAAALIAQFGSLEELLRRAGEVPGKRGEKLRASAGLLPLSQALVRLRDDVPIELDLHSARSAGLKLERLIPICKELGFNRYQDEVRELLGKGAGAASGAVSGEAGEPTPAAKDVSGSGASAVSTIGATAVWPASPVVPAARGGRSAGKAAGKSSGKSGGRSASDGGLFDALEPPPGAEGSSASEWGLAGDSSGGSLADFLGGGAGGDGGGAVVTQAAGSLGEKIVQGEYTCVRTADQLADLVGALRDSPVFALDTETTGLSAIDAKLCGLSFSTREGRAWYVPVRSPEPGNHLSAEAVLGALRPILEDPAKPKFGHNLKFDMLALRAAGVALDGLGAAGACDTMVASYLIDSSRSSHALGPLSLAILGVGKRSIMELIGGAGKGEITFDRVPIERATPYAAGDADLAFRLATRMLPQIRLMGMEALLAEVEMPLVGVLAELEWNGIRVEPAELDRQRERLMGRIVELAAELDREAIRELNRKFDPDSPKQLAAALFNKPDDEPSGLGLPGGKRTKTGFSTDAEVLEKLAQGAAVATPIPGLILEYRQLSKLVSNYLVSLKEAINPRTGRVHASFHQTVAATGRLSSSDPNLQNIPIRTEIGREIRRAFVAPPGRRLVSADYSQIELRLLAHLSRDPGLIEAFRQDQDIHQAVAAQIHGVPPDRVTREQRAGAKMVNFGIVYGITAFGLARRLGIETASAEKIITDYKKRFAGITTFLQECIDQARRFGYVETMLKRRRVIPDIESTNPSSRALAERTAINSVVQGSAADLIKIAMVDIQARLRAARDGARGHEPALADTRMLLQIHDELVFESPAEYAEDVRKIVVERMERAMSPRDARGPKF